MKPGTAGRTAEIIAQGQCIFMVGRYFCLMFMGDKLFRAVDSAVLGWPGGDPLA